jgi:hypothetical protein
VSKRTIGVITPPWLTESGQPEVTQVDIEGEGAAARLADACDWTIEQAADYLEFLSIGKAEYDSAVKYGDIGHA